MIEPISSAKKIILVLLGLVILSVVYNFINPNPPRSRHVKPATEKPEVKVIVNSQAAEGTTQANMNQNFLHNFESYTVKRINEKVENHYKSRGLPVPKLNIRSESNFIILGNTKLAIVRIFEEGVSNSALILGIKGNEILRVGCFSNSTYQVEITTGKCGEAIEKTYGVTFK